jgi:hypothetical protein
VCAAIETIGLEAASDHHLVIGKWDWAHYLKTGIFQHAAE